MELSKKTERLVRGLPAVMLSNDLEALCNEALVRRFAEEQENAILIQRFWRRCLIRAKWAELLALSRYAVKIQKVARGMIVRTLVARWYHERNRVVTDWQARVRRYFSNKRIRPQLRLENESTVKIQAGVRMFLARRRVRRLRQNMVATRIQCLWRGVVARVKTDRDWLEPIPTPIQRRVRGYLARKRIPQLRYDLNFAATRIQRVYFAYKARRRLATKAFDRDTEYREAALASFGAEEDWHRDRWQRIQRRVDKMQLKQHLAEAEAALQSKFEEINKLEHDSETLILQRQVISPRAIVQGWAMELDKNIGEHRAWLTERKLDAIFNVAYTAREQKEQLSLIEKEIAKHQQLSAIAALHREAEVEHMFERDAVKRHDESTFERRRKVADEKRRWAVQYFNPEGKPDKQRRPGRPWDPAILAGPERDVFTAKADLFAFQRPLPGDTDDEPHLSAASKDVNKVLSKLSLENYLEQVQHYDEVINPMFTILNKYMAKNPAAVAAAQQAPPTAPQPRREPSDDEPAAPPPPLLADL